MFRRTLLAGVAALPLLTCVHAPVRAPGGRRPIVIAHRGASAYRPEHTLAAYELAIEQGADFIECDLVPTRDGVLIARHENELSRSTDVASRPLFADRRTEKRIDGERVQGWFAEDFTLDEIKSLRCIEPLPDLRAESRRHDGRHAIPTLGEVIALAARAGVGLYPETKHPSYFAYVGRRLDGEPIGIDITTRLLDALEAAGFTDPTRLYLQSFELGNLLDCARREFPARHWRAPLVLLLGDLDPAAPANAFSRPFDLGALDPALPSAVPLELGQILGQAAALRYADLARPEALRWLAAQGIAGIGPWKESLLERRPLDTPIDIDGDGRAELRWQRTGRIHPVIADARQAGLEVHPYTLRAEERYLALAAGVGASTMEAEMRLLLESGCSGWFTDFPDRGVAVREAWMQGLGRVSAPRARS